LKLHHEKIGSGPPVVVLHGLFGSGRNWATVAKALSHQYSFFLVDLRNHGKSPHTDSMKYDAMADDVLQFIKELELYKTTLIGHSMGGKVAMTCALKTPTIVKNLVAIDIAPVAYPNSFSEILAALNAMPLDQIHSRKDADTWLETSIPEISIRSFILQNLSIKESIATWRFNLKAITSNILNLVGSLPDLTKRPFEGPTCFIRGALSDRVAVPAQPKIKRFFPKNRIQTVPDAGHWPHTENRAEFLKILKSCLDENH
jgi:esterase